MATRLCPSCYIEWGKTKSSQIEIIDENRTIQGKNEKCEKSRGMCDVYYIVEETLTKNSLCERYRMSLISFDS